MRLQWSNLNQFSRNCRSMSVEQIRYLSDLLESFLKACVGLPDDAFLNKKNSRFNVALFEAAFAAVCGPPFAKKKLLEGSVSSSSSANSNPTSSSWML